MKKLRLVTFFLVMVIILVGVTSAVADSELVEYRWLLSAGDLSPILPGVPLCDPSDPTAPPCPNIATAANGDTIVLTGEGLLSVHPKTASGSGTFVHKDPQGGVLGGGTWHATELLSFSSYGPSPLPGWPAEFQSGRARIKVDLMVGGAKVADAILTVGCLLPGVDAPDAVFEGGTLNVQGGPNFSKLGGGGMFSTLFIQL